MLVELTPLNPAQDASLAPGDYRTTSNNAAAWLESFGALAVVLTDADGGSYELAAGQLPFDLSLQKGANIAQLKEEMFTKFFPMETVSVTEGDALTLELSSFLDCVRTGRRPVVNGEDALKAVEVAEGILQSMEAHAWNGTSAGPTGIQALFSPAAKAAA